MKKSNKFSPDVRERAWCRSIAESIHHPKDRLRTALQTMQTVAEPTDIRPPKAGKLTPFHSTLEQALTADLKCCSMRIT